MRADAQNTADKISKSLELLAQRLDVETAPYRLEEFNARVEDPNLWDDPDAAQKLMRDRQALVDSIATYEGIKQELADNIELIELGEMEGDDEARLLLYAQGLVNQAIADLLEDPEQMRKLLEIARFKPTLRLVHNRDSEHG